MTMEIPDDTKCRKAMKAWANEPALTEWEAEFVESNQDRHEFTAAQRSAIGRMLEKYDL